MPLAKCSFGMIPLSRHSVDRSPRAFHSSTHNVARASCFEVLIASVESRKLFLDVSLLINDTSDHLPIFQMTDIGINGNKNNFAYNKKRIVTDRNICEIISELEKREWGDILNSDDVNFSYETFVNKLTDIYRKKCPIVTSKVTNKRHYKPWMTSGLKNACKKRNLLYKYFLKSRLNKVRTNTRHIQIN